MLLDLKNTGFDSPLSYQTGRLGKNVFMGGKGFVKPNRMFDGAALLLLHSGDVHGRFDIEDDRHKTRHGDPGIFPGAVRYPKTVRVL